MSEERLINLKQARLLAVELVQMTPSQLGKLGGLVLVAGAVTGAMYTTKQEIDSRIEVSTAAEMGRIEMERSRIEKEREISVAAEKVRIQLDYEKNSSEIRIKEVRETRFWGLF